MSAFGKFGTGGKVPGNYPMPSDDNYGSFSYDVAADGTEDNTPDSKPEIVATDFGSVSHNPPNPSPKAST